jgi:PAS domain-containing protein
MRILDRLGRLRPPGRPAADPGRVLRRRRGPLQLALVGALITLIIVVELLILRAYVNVSRTTAIFGQVSFVTGNLVNVQREVLLLNVKVEELPASGDLKGVRVRRALLANQLFQLSGQGEHDPLVAETLRAVASDLQPIDRAIARAGNRPTRASLHAEVTAMRPALRRLNLHVKELYDKEEQRFFGALTGALDARGSSERLLVGLSGMVLLVAVALVLSLRQRVRSDFDRAWRTLTAEVEERKAAEAALRASEERFRSLVQNSSDVITILDAERLIRYQSESVRRVLGYEPAELATTDLMMLVHPDDQERVARFVSEAATRPATSC